MGRTARSLRVCLRWRLPMCRGTPAVEYRGRAIAKLELNRIRKSQYLSRYQNIPSLENFLMRKNTSNSNVYLRANLIHSSTSVSNNPRKPLQHLIIQIHQRPTLTMQLRPLVSTKSLQRSILPNPLHHPLRLSLKKTYHPQHRPQRPASQSSPPPLPQAT